MSQIFDIGLSFDFMIKNGKLVVIVFFYIYISFHKMKNNTSIQILRHSSLHIYHAKYFGRILAEILTFEKSSVKKLIS